ncbi:hypothetical protein ACOME3_006566 [Neoechinorhynchus agilis]
MPTAMRSRRRQTGKNLCFYPWRYLPHETTRTLQLLVEIHSCQAKKTSSSNYPSMEKNTRYRFKMSLISRCLAIFNRTSSGNVSNLLLIVIVFKRIISTRRKKAERKMNDL